jgi:hypothetical protein
MERKVGAWALGLVIFGTALSAKAANPTIYRFDATLSSSNVVTLSWETSGGDQTQPGVYINHWTIQPGDPNYPGDWDPGSRPLDCTSVTHDACSTSVRVRPGTHRFTLAVNGPVWGERMTQEVEITVPPLPPPNLSASKRVSLDMFRVAESTPAQRTLSWTAPSGVTGGYVKLTKPGSFFPEPTNYPTTGSYIAIASDLKFGANTYQLQYCQDVPPRSDLGETAPVVWCSQGLAASIVVEPSRFTTPASYRVWAPANQPFDLQWTGTTGNGNFWVVQAPTLGLGEWVTNTSFQIPAAKMVPGFHDVTLVSAVWGGPWSNHAELASTAAGTAHCILPNGTEVWSGSSRLLRITAPTTPPSLVVDPSYCMNPPTGADVELLAPDFGTSQVNVNDGAAVQIGDPVAFVELDYAPHVDHKQIIVGDPNPAWKVRSFDTDFADKRYYRTDLLSTVGLPLDVYVAPDGNIWGSSEFGSALTHGLPDGTVTRHEVPLAGFWNASAARFESVRPFSSFGNPTTAGGGERVIGGGGYIWVPQGGDLWYSGSGNYSRIMRFDPAVADNPVTEWDDRMCMYNVPTPVHTDPANGNNWVLSVAWDAARHRLWFTENNQAHAALSWLDPAKLSCDNFLDYSNLTSIQNAVHQYCSSGATNNDPCIHKVDLSPTQTDQSLAAVVDPLHLIVDGNAVWLNEFLGQHVVRYDIATNTARRFPTPKKNARGPFTALFGSSLAQIRADANYVYFNEYADADLVRIDKSKLATPNLCETLDATGKNPCMDEIHLPALDNAANAAGAWMDLDTSRGRAWFSFAQNQPYGDDAAIGWVDVTSFKPGVLYTGLGTIVDPARQPFGPSNFGGISADPGSGKVAVTDYTRDEIVLLCPTTCDANSVDLTPANATFELDTNSDGIPNSWTKSGLGTVSLPTETFGARAVKLLPNTGGGAGNDVFLDSTAVTIPIVPPATSKLVVTTAALTSGSIGLARVEVSAYSTTNGTGTAVASYILSVTGTPSQFKRYTFKSTSFPSTARSIKVRLHAQDGSARFAEFDDLRVAMSY